MIVLSTATSVKVLKAIGQVPLRLFPGHTDIGNADLDKYTKGNAAKALFTECLSVVGSKELTPAQKSKAKKAKKKN
ncbi:MAG: hypothetical protein GY746_13700, partial [Gammaproteobacteria bacterium]|nr:hypothetical protein [Gammaproteobacteria bacterium]